MLKQSFFFFFFPSLAVAEVKLRDDQYTLDHMRAFGMYNYLHLDSWYQDNVYYVDQFGRVMNLSVTLVRINFLKKLNLKRWGVDKVENTASRIQMQKLGEALASKTGRLTKMQFTRKDERILSEVSNIFLLVVLHQYRNSVASTSILGKIDMVDKLKKRVDASFLVAGCFSLCYLMFVCLLI